ncbi:hypothetical protein GC093_30220, partial [Paenibacillus sp. LMG 31456]
MVKIRIAVVIFVLWISSMMTLAQAVASPQATISDPYGQLSAAPKKITVVSVPGLSFLELDPQDSKQDRAVVRTLPHIKELKHKSAWGALNIRTPGKGLEDVYISMGTGQIAEANSGVAGIQTSEQLGGEKAWQKHQRVTGISASGSKDGIVVPQMEVIKRLNASNYYHARPGLLGESLEAAGIHVSVWGNLDLMKAEAGLKETDLGRTYRRYASLMLMNEAGKVQQGDVSGSGLIMDSSRPYGIRTNYSWLMDRWREQVNPALVLLELGDLGRLYDERDSYSKEAFMSMKQEVVKELDRFIGELTRAMEMKPGGVGELWLLSPQINGEAAKEKALLAPIMMYSPSGKEALLTSATTRRSGLITIVDIAPTLLRAYGIQIPKEMIGLPAVGESTADALPKLLKDLQHMQSVYSQRPKLLYGLAVYEIIVMLGALAVAWYFTGSSSLGKRGITLWRSLLFSLLIAPLGLLLMGWLTFQSEGTTAAVMGGIFGISIIIALAAARIRRGFVFGLAAIGLTVTGVILYDGFHGSIAMQRSVLGYDPMIGARYYGIGNEFMGVLLGAALLGLTALQQALRLSRRPRRAVPEPEGSSTASGAFAPAPAREAAFADALLPAPVGFAAWRMPPLGAFALWPRASAPAVPLRTAASTG